MYGLCCCRAGRAVSAAVRPLCAVGLSGSCQAVTLGPDSDGTPLMSGSAVRLSDTCCQAVRESAVNAVRLSGTVRRCPGFAVRLSDQGSELERSQVQGSVAAWGRAAAVASRRAARARRGGQVIGRRVMGRRVTAPSDRSEPIVARPQLTSKACGARLSVSGGGRHVARREDDKCASYGSLFIGQSSGAQVETEAKHDGFEQVTSNAREICFGAKSLTRFATKKRPQWKRGLTGGLQRESATDCEER